MNEAILFFPLFKFEEYDSSFPSPEGPKLQKIMFESKLSMKKSPPYSKLICLLILLLAVQLSVSLPWPFRRPPPRHRPPPPAPITGAPPYHDIKFFYFVIQWPGSFWNSRQGCYPTSGKPVGDFGIHGLWPALKNGNTPSFCDNRSPFNISSVMNNIEIMQAYWPCLTCPSNDGSRFWSHEWEKHGTCSMNLLNQSAYFKAALDLRRRLNILRPLNAKGIRPMNGQVYDMRTIERVIYNVTGHTPTIQCNEDMQGKRQIFEIYLCADNTASRFIRCPTSLKLRSMCTSRVAFPIF